MKELFNKARSVRMLFFITYWIVFWEISTHYISRNGNTLAASFWSAGALIYLPFVIIIYFLADKIFIKPSFSRKKSIIIHLFLFILILGLSFLLNPLYVQTVIGKVIRSIN